MDYYADLLNQKTLSDADLSREWDKLKSYDATENNRSFAGNNLIYHYFLDKMCQCATEKGYTIKGLMTNPDTLNYWLEQMNKRGRTGTEAVRLFECIRVSRCPIVFFKPSIAKHIYKTLGATRVLDPCAGWGGRMLGALALGIPYTGIDTNLELKMPYYNLFNDHFNSVGLDNVSQELVTPALPGHLQPRYKMIFKSALEVDFAEIDYDFVLTSPPYFNLEVYQGMSPWPTEDAFYTGFLVPLLNKCRKNVRRSGKVLFNISPKMYKKLTGKYKYQTCYASYHMLQQKRNGVDKGDLIYQWN